MYIAIVTIIIKNYVKNTAICAKYAKLILQNYAF